MIYESTGYVTFSISGKELNKNDFMNHFQITPTKTGIDKNRINYLEYSIKAGDANEGLDNAINKLVDLFSACIIDVKKYSLEKKLYIKIFIVIYSSNSEDNGVFFDRRFIEFLYKLGAEIEIDIYNR